MISAIKERKSINRKIAAHKVFGKCERAAKLTLENNDFQIDLGKWRGYKVKNKLVMITSTRILS